MTPLSSSNFSQKINSLAQFSNSKLMEVANLIPLGSKPFSLTMKFSIGKLVLTPLSRME